MLDLLYPNINLAKVQSQRDEIFIERLQDMVQKLQRSEINLLNNKVALP